MRRCLLVVSVFFFLALVQASFGQAGGVSRRVDSIELTGSEAFDQATVTNQLRKVKVGEWTNSCMIESDIEANLKAFLKKSGFVQCEVTFDEVPLTDRSMRLQIRVSEGPQYRLASLDLKGMKILTKEKIIGLFGVQPGDIVDFSKIKNGLERLKQIYENFGFIDCSFVPEQSFDPLNKTAALSFTVDEGRQYFIAYVVFAGCRNQTEEDRLMAQTQTRPGRVFNPTVLKTDAIRLNTLGVVKESMEILDAEKGLVGIVFWLKPDSKK